MQNAALHIFMFWKMNDLFFFFFLGFGGFVVVSIFLIGTDSPGEITQKPTEVFLIWSGL